MDEHDTCIMEGYYSTTFAIPVKHGSETISQQNCVCKTVRSPVSPEQIVVKWLSTVRHVIQSTLQRLALSFLSSNANISLRIIINENNAKN